MHVHVHMHACACLTIFELVDAEGEPCFRIAFMAKRSPESERVTASTLPNPPCPSMWCTWTPRRGPHGVSKTGMGRHGAGAMVHLEARGTAVQQQCVHQLVRAARRALRL